MKIVEINMELNYLSEVELNNLKGGCGDEEEEEDEFFYASPTASCSAHLSYYDAVQAFQNNCKKVF